MFIFRMLLYFALLTNYDNSIHRKLSIVWIEKCSNYFFWPYQVEQTWFTIILRVVDGCFLFLKPILLTNVCQVSLLIGWSRNGTLLLKSVPFRDHTIKKHISQGFLNIYWKNDWIQAGFFPLREEASWIMVSTEKNFTDVQKLRYLRNNLGVCIGLNHNKGAGAKIFT